MNTLSDYREIWLADFEFRPPDGELPEPLCLVAQENTNRAHDPGLGGRPGRAAGPALPGWPRCVAGGLLCVGRIGVLSCIEWPLPVRIIDLYAEFRCRTSRAAGPVRKWIAGRFVLSRHRQYRHR